MTEQPPHPIRVTFRKQVSDGNYGTESAEVTLEAWADSDEEEDDMSEALLSAARRHVHAELARSPSAKVRATVGASPQPVAIAGSPRWIEDDDKDLPL